MYNYFNINKIMFIFLNFILFGLWGCNRIYEDHVIMASNDFVWNKNDPIEFEVNINDIKTPYDIKIGIRHGKYMKHKNLLISSDSYAPSGKKHTMTRKVLLQNELGEWTGNASDNLWNNELMFVQSENFSEAGKYKFVLTHKMSNPSIPLIMEVGLILDKVNSQD
jgi:gliding motility-associated lipoprotein GldH